MGEVERTINLMQKLATLKLKLITTNNLERAAHTETKNTVKKKGNNLSGLQKSKETAQ